MPGEPRAGTFMGTSTTAYTELHPHSARIDKHSDVQKCKRACPCPGCAPERNVTGRMERPNGGVRERQLCLELALRYFVHAGCFVLTCVLQRRRGGEGSAKDCRRKTGSSHAEQTISVRQRRQAGSALQATHDIYVKKIQGGSIHDKWQKGQWNGQEWAGLGRNPEETATTRTQAARSTHTGFMRRDLLASHVG